MTEDIYTRPQTREYRCNHHPFMTYFFIFILLCALAYFIWLAFYNTTPFICDDISFDGFNNKWTCETDLIKGQDGFWHIKDNGRRITAH